MEVPEHQVNTWLLRFGIVVWFSFLCLVTQRKCYGLHA
jgi:hypothetical protein